MFKISLNHTNGFVGKKAQPNTTKQIHTSMRCHLRHGGGLLQIKGEFSYLQIVRMSPPGHLHIVTH